MKRLLMAVVAACVAAPAFAQTNQEVINRAVLAAPANARAAAMVVKWDAGTSAAHVMVPGH